MTETNNTAPETPEALEAPGRHEIENLAKQAFDAAISTPRWVAVIVGSNTTLRTERAMKAAGFSWTGREWASFAEIRPKHGWGFRVRRYHPPKPPRKGFGAAVGIMIGTHDEFGHPL